MNKKKVSKEVHGTLLNVSIVLEMCFRDVEN